MILPFPAYLELYDTGELHRRVERAVSLLGKCVICPRACRANRLADERGECRVGRRAMVASYGPHFGEERPLVGQYGSGTIFFSYCSLRCLFCQNYTISQMGEGEEVSPAQLASMMLHLQRQGCHNINFVTPTHVVPQILEALEIAVPQGLHLPLVYNTGGYDSLATVRLLDGIIDIYMPDMKYSDARIAEELSSIRDYPKVNRAAVKAMQAQVGDLVTDEAGIARRGLIIRHLVLPHGLAGTEDILHFIAEEISRDAYVNIMDQYRPCYRAHGHPLLNRPVTREEFLEALRLAESVGLTRVDEHSARSPF